MECHLKYFFALYLLIALFSSPIKANDYRLPKNIILNSQAVSLDLDPSKASFSGETTFDLSAHIPTDVISYHSKHLVIESVELTHNAHSVSLPIEKPNTFDIVHHKLDEMISGQAKLHIKFKGEFSNQARGVFVQKSDTEAPYIFSQFQPMQARRVFPSFNEPDKKTVFQFTLTIPSDLNALHNSKILSTKVESDKKVIRFEKTTKIPTDVLAIAVGVFDKKRLAGTRYNTTLFSPKGLIYAYHEEIPTLINNTITYLSDYLAQPFPYDKLDFFIAPFESSAAMENVGLIALSPKEIPELGASDDDMCNFRKLIAHEIAHMWFGNDITMQWYDDYWMNESFSEFFAAHIIQHYYPTQAQCTYNPQSVSLEDDNDKQRAVRHQVRSATEQDGTGQLVYSKGFSVLAMIEQSMGEDTFKNLIRKYVDNTKGSVTSLATFEHFLPKTLKNIPASFLNHSSYPLVTMYREGDQLYVKQKNYFEKDKLWSIPLTLKLYDTGKLTYKNVLLNTESMSLDGVSPTTQVFIDTQGVGYFRYMDKTNNAKFPLNLLSDSEKLSYMENNEALASSAYIDYISYVDTLILTLNNLPTDSIESSKALNSFINSFIEFIPTHLKPSYTRYLLSQLPADIDWKTVFNKRNGGDWLEFYGVYLKSETAIKFAKNILKEGNIMDSLHRVSILRVVAAHSSDIEYRKLVKMFSKGGIKFKEDLLDSLGTTEKASQITAFYELLLSDLATEFTIDYRFQFPALNAKNRAFVAHYITENKARILSRIPKEGSQWFVYNFMTACSSAESKLIESTFESWKNIDGLPQKLNVVLSGINKCIVNSKVKVSSIVNRVNTKI